MSEGEVVLAPFPVRIVFPLGLANGTELEKMGEGLGQVMHHARTTVYVEETGEDEDGRVIRTLRPLTVPVLAANTIRGSLRRAALASLLEAAELTPGDFASSKDRRFNYHFLASGGGLKKKEENGDSEAADSKRIELTFDQLKKLRDLWPFVGLFGGSYDVMIPGALRVNPGIPALEVLRWQFEQVYATPVGPLYSLLDDSQVPPLQMQTEHRKPDRGVPVKLDDNGKSRVRNMFYSYEVLPGGIPLIAGVHTLRTTRMVLSCLGDALDRWSKLDHIGGQSRVGVGLMRVEPIKLTGLLDPEPYRDFLRKNSARIKKTLLAAKSITDWLAK